MKKNYYENIKIAAKNRIDSYKFLLSFQSFLQTSAVLEQFFSPRSPSERRHMGASAFLYYSKGDEIKFHM